MSTTTSIEELTALIEARGARGRSLTAIVGAPAAGKSTLAEVLAARLNRRQPGSAAVLGMDGYHYDDRVLEERGWRPRKGASHTFDVAGLRHMIERLAVNAEDEIAVPVFDRDLEIARAGARIIPRTVRHLILEGNYLMLDVAPWRDLARFFATTVFLDVPEATSRARLEARWKELAPDRRRAKIEENDLPNAREVIGRSRPCEFVVRDLANPEA